METIGEARQFLIENGEKGTICPCCERIVKIYHRSITSAMAYGIVLIYRYFKNHPNAEWLHIEDYFKTLDIPSSIRGDVAKLKYWELLEGKKGLREDGSKRNGYYRMTEKGKMFAQNQLQVPKYMIMANRKCLGFSDELTYINACFGRKFNYDELMNG